MKRKLQNAYAMAEYADAKRALDRLHRELMDINPSAARSLEEGMEERVGSCACPDLEARSERINGSRAIERPACTELSLSRFDRVHAFSLALE